MYPRRENLIRTRRLDSRRGRARFFRHLSSRPRYHPEAITGYLAMRTVFFPLLYGNAKKEKRGLSPSRAPRALAIYLLASTKDGGIEIEMRLSLRNDIEPPIVR